MQNQPPIINIKMVPAGVELVVRALRSVSPLPDPNVDGLVNEIWGQYVGQMQELQQAAQAAQAAEATQPQAEAAAPAVAPSEPVAEAAVGGAE